MPSIPISQHSRLKLFGDFPIARAQTPRLPPSHVSQRGPTSHQAEKSRSGPHRKTLNFAAIRSKCSNVFYCRDFFINTAFGEGLLRSDLTCIPPIVSYFNLQHSTRFKRYLLLLIVLQNVGYQ
jgi:hypothetical protein